jgi:peroxiredoxin
LKINHPTYFVGYVKRLALQPMKDMKQFLLILAFVISLSVSAQEDSTRGYIVKVGDPLPTGYVLKLENGKTINPESLQGKVVLLQFTASWCSVCREEMPHLEADIWKKYKDKGLVMVGVDRDEPLDVVKNFSKEMKISYPLALDPNADIFGKFAKKEAGVTRNVLIDRNGKIVFLTRLYNEQEFELLKQKVASLF